MRPHPAPDSSFLLIQIPGGGDRVPATHTGQLHWVSLKPALDLDSPWPMWALQGEPAGKSSISGRNKWSICSDGWSPPAALLTEETLFPPRRDHASSLTLANRATFHTSSTSPFLPSFSFHLYFLGRILGLFSSHMSKQSAWEASTLIPFGICAQTPNLALRLAPVQERAGSHAHTHTCSPTCAFTEAKQLPKTKIT